jgi:hypothetical protein
MKNLISRLLTGLAAGALAIATVIAASAPAQAAADTYTPHGGPIVAAIGDNIAITFIEPGQTFTCEQFDLSGALGQPDSSRPFGAVAATWDQLAHSGCTNAIWGRTTFAPTSIWGFSITGPEVGSISPAAFTNIGVHIVMGGCSFNVTGEVSGGFDDTTGVFTPTGSTLMIADDPVGFLCPISGFAQDQSISVSGTWTITGLTITNP